MGKVKKKKGKGVECNIFFGCGNPLSTRAHDEIQTGIPTTFILATQRMQHRKVCVLYQCGMDDSPWTGEGNGKGKRKRGERVIGEGMGLSKWNDNYLKLPRRS